MTKKELINAIAAKGYTKKDVRIALDAIFETIGEQIVAGETVKISGFGTFGSKEHAEKTGYNIQTKEYVKVPPYKTIKFIPSQGLKDLLNDK